MPGTQLSPSLSHLPADLEPLAFHFRGTLEKGLGPEGRTPVLIWVCSALCSKAWGTSLPCLASVFLPAQWGWGEAFGLDQQQHKPEIMPL